MPQGKVGTYSHCPCGHAPVALRVFRFDCRDLAQLCRGFGIGYGLRRTSSARGRSAASSRAGRRAGEDGGSVRLV